MKINDIVDKTTLKKYCNYNSWKNWRGYVKKGSPLPQSIYSHKKNASGSIQYVELFPINFKFDSGFAQPIYWNDIDGIILSYDSPIGYTLINNNNLYVLNPKCIMTTNTTNKILLTLIKNVVIIPNENVIVLKEHFGIYKSYRLKDVRGRYL